MSRATECDDVEACGQGDAGRSCTDASTFDLLSTERINSYIYDLFRFPQAFPTLILLYGLPSSPYVYFKMRSPF